MPGHLKSVKCICNFFHIPYNKYQETKVIAQCFLKATFESWRQGWKSLNPLSLTWKRREMNFCLVAKLNTYIKKNEKKGGGPALQQRRVAQPGRLQNLCSLKSGKDFLPPCKHQRKAVPARRLKFLPSTHLSFRTDRNAPHVLGMGGDM